MHFTRRMRYRFGDIDHAGIGYFPKLLHYFHCCFEDWWYDALALPYHSVLDDDDWGLPCRHLDVEYLGPVRYGDAPDVNLGILALGESSVRFGFWMQNEGEPRPLCIAVATTVSVRVSQMQKIPIPEGYRRAFAPWLLEDGEFPQQAR